MDYILQISGMHCQNCVKSVREALSSIEGVDSVEVDLKTGQAHVHTQSEISHQKFEEQIDETGFDLESIK